MTSKDSLWDLVKSDEYNSEDDTFNINDFRLVGGFNSRLATWDPMEKSSRFFKSLLFAFASHLDNKIIKELNIDKKLQGSGIHHFLKNISKTNLGQPLSIKYYQDNVDIDYLLSLEEILFLHKYLINCKSILEIGPGFGRLTHSIISNFNNIENYFLIDLDWMLDISKAYLKEVLNKENFSKIKFISVEEYNNKNFDIISSQSKIDMAINIDSFQEMPTDVAKDYLKFIGDTCEYFYSKNAICKYKPSDVDIHLKDESQYRAALEMGLCKEVIDIYNTNEIEIQKENYFKSYCPKNFKLKKSEQCFGQYLYYFSSLYKKHH